MACILFFPAFRSVFHLTLLSGYEWLIVLGLSLLSIVQVEIVKTVRRIVATKKNRAM